jgi:serine/threonine protein kinase
MKDVNYILVNDQTAVQNLMSPYVTRDVAQAILTAAKGKIHSATKKRIGLQYSFLLDGPLGAGQGQSKSSLCYAFAKDGGVFVAKVYNGHEEDFLREVNVSQTMEHQNLVKFIKYFSLEGGRHVIIMPFFPRSAADLLIQSYALSLPAIRVIARSCFDALCYMHGNRFCFADLKPPNIMLMNARPNYATLVDYGAAVSIGSPVIEFSQQYCLDANTTIASEQLDWICLGTTLAQLAGFGISIYKTANYLGEAISLSDQNVYLKQLILSCLENPTESGISTALINFENQ